MINYTAEISVTYIKKTKFGVKVRRVPFTLDFSSEDRFGRSEEKQIVDSFRRMATEQKLIKKDAVITVERIKAI